jgi:hypothetical protein
MASEKQREQIIATSLQIDALRRKLAEEGSRLESLLSGKRADSRQREQIIAISLQIDALRRKLAEAEGRLESLLSGKRADSGAKPKAAPAEDDNAIIPPRAANEDLSLAERLVAFLGANPELEFSAADIQGLLPGTNLNSIRSALYRLAKDVRIKRGARGHFGSIEPAGE